MARWGKLDLFLSDDLDLELRLARFEELMDRRPFLLSRYGTINSSCLNYIISLPLSLPSFLPPSLVFY